MHSERYEATLRSPRWRQLKWRRIQIAEFRCEKCGAEFRGSRAKRAMRYFDLHHLHYRRVGAEDINDVQVLCRGCHEAVHGR
jgi:predicted HNH restriction endonuclease